MCSSDLGGIALLGAAAIGYLASHVRRGVVFSDQTLVMFVGVALMAGIGLVDDWLKVRTRQNRGVLWKLKGWITLGVSMGIAGVLVAITDVSTRLSFTARRFPAGNSVRWCGPCGRVSSSSPPRTP